MSTVSDAASHPTVSSRNHSEGNARWQYMALDYMAGSGGAAGAGTHGAGGGLGNGRRAIWLYKRRARAGGGGTRRAGRGGVRWRRAFTCPARQSRLRPPLYHQPPMTGPVKAVRGFFPTQQARQQHSTAQIEGGRGEGIHVGMHEVGRCGLCGNVTGKERERAVDGAFRMTASKWKIKDCDSGRQSCNYRCRWRTGRPSATCPRRCSRRRTRCPESPSQYP
jgi:hypothetical protein